MSGRARLALVVLATLLAAAPGAAASASRGSHPRGGPVHQLVLRGTWVQPGCAPTAPPVVDVEGQTLAASCDGVAGYSGDLTGYAIQHIDATAGAETTNATIVADIYGRTAGNLCGTLRLDPEAATVTAPDATGVGPIVSGTGDFSGVTGWYDTSGYAAGGYGAGDYTITLRFRGRPPTPSAVPCTPPAPSGTARR